MKKIWSLSGLLAACCFAASANAGVMVTQWAFSLNGSWSGATFGAGGGAQTQNATEISWGESGADMKTVGSGRSGLEITNANAAGMVNTNGAAAVTNTITHYNNVVNGGYATMLTAGLDSSLSLTPVLPVPGPLIGPTVINFVINFAETSNSAPCGFPSGSVCDDIFVIDKGSLNNQFVYDGFTYFVSFFESTNNLTPLPAATCAAANVAAGCLGLTTQEGQFTPATFVFTVTSRPVGIPLPGSLFLLGIGLLGLAAARRPAPARLSWAR